MRRIVVITFAAVIAVWGFIQIRSCNTEYRYRRLSADLVKRGSPMSVMIRTMYEHRKAEGAPIPTSMEEFRNLMEAKGQNLLLRDDEREDRLAYRAVLFHDVTTSQGGTDKRDTLTYLRQNG